jgi:hypothetical protein
MYLDIIVSIKKNLADLLLLEGDSLERADPLKFSALVDVVSGRLSKDPRPDRPYGLRPEPGRPEFAILVGLSDAVPPGL